MKRQTSALGRKQTLTNANKKPDATSGFTYVTRTLATTGGLINVLGQANHAFILL